MELERAAGPQQVSYGSHPDQYAELWLPQRTPRGVVVVVHGGFWRASYDCALGRPLAASLVEHGWAAWNLEYRRVGGGGGAPATLDDVAAGIDRLAHLRVDGEPLHLGTVIALGHSAGGHLAAWAAGRGRHERWADPAVPVTAVVSQAGVLDLRAGHAERLGDGAVEQFLGRPPVPGDVADPAQQLPLGVPVRCVHGRDDEAVPVEQSRSYVAGARAAGDDATLLEVDADHMSLIDPAGEAWRRTLELLDGLARSGPAPVAT